MRGHLNRSLAEGAQSLWKEGATASGGGRSRPGTAAPLGRNRPSTAVGGTPRTAGGGGAANSKSAMQGRSQSARRAAPTSSRSSPVPSATAASPTGRPQTAAHSSKAGQSPAGANSVNHTRRSASSPRPASAAPHNVGGQSQGGAANGPGQLSRPASAAWSPRVKSYVQDRTSRRARLYLADRLLVAAIPKPSAENLALLAHQMLNNAEIESDLIVEEEEEEEGDEEAHQLLQDAETESDLIVEDEEEGIEEAHQMLQDAETQSDVIVDEDEGDEDEGGDDRSVKSKAESSKSNFRPSLKTSFYGGSEGPASTKIRARLTSKERKEQGEGGEEKASGQAEGADSEIAENCTPPGPAEDGSAQPGASGSAHHVDPSCSPVPPPPERFRPSCKTSRNSHSFIASSLIQAGSLSALPGRGGVRTNEGGHRSMKSVSMSVLPQESMKPGLADALRRPNTGYGLPQVGMASPAGTSVRSLKKPPQGSSAILEQFKALSLVAKGAAPAGTKDPVEEIFKGPKKVELRIGDHIPRPTTILASTVNDVLNADLTFDPEAAAAEAAAAEGGGGDGKLQLNFYERKQAELLSAAPLALLVATGDGGPDKLYQFWRDTMPDPRHICMFEHVEGCRFCESLYGHYLLPSGKLAHIYMGDTVRKGHKVDLIPPPLCPFSAESVRGYRDPGKAERDRRGGRNGGGKKTEKN
eukprot:gene845-2224_t